MTSVFVSTNCLPKPTREAITELTHAGINNIELGPTQKYDGGIEDFLTSVDAHFIIHNYFPSPRNPFILNLASSNKQVREKSLAQARKSINMCARLGSSLYSVHAGFVTDPTFGAKHFTFAPGRKDNDYEVAFNQFVDSVNKLLEIARAAGVRIAVENNVCLDVSKGHLLLSEATEFERLFREVPSPDLGINLDLGHLNVSSRTLGFDKSDFVRRIKNRIFAIHVHDNDGTSDTHNPLAEDSWTLRLLAHESFAEQIPVVLEAHNLTSAQISSQIQLIERAIKH